MNKKIRNEKIIKAHYVFFVEKILIFLYNNTIKNHLTPVTIKTGNQTKLF